MNIWGKPIQQISFPFLAWDNSNRERNVIQCHRATVLLWLLIDQGIFCWFEWFLSQLIVFYNFQNLNCHILAMFESSDQSYWKHSEINASFPSNTKAHLEIRTKSKTRGNRDFFQELLKFVPKCKMLLNARMLFLK